MRALLASLLLLAACGGGPDDEVQVCYFESGRPCPADTICMGPQGAECNYYSCAEGGAILGTAIGCQTGATEPLPGGPFNCDPATVMNDPAPGTITPPQGACFLGALRVIDPSSSVFPFRECVPVSQCLPIACDPQFNGDGCPSGYGCDAATETCVAQ